MDDLHSDQIDASQIIEILTHGEVVALALMADSSNYTLLCTVEYAQTQVLGIYKPRLGERPLWDFPPGTLCRREVAAYVLSEALGFGLVPPTVLRDGPYGVGMLQLFIENDAHTHLFTMLKEGNYQAEIRRLCAFDVLINNADRKSGHALQALDGRFWAIDHGICFHSEPKLRTVLWDFVGEPLPADVLAAFDHLCSDFDHEGVLAQFLIDLLDVDEFRALRTRLHALLDTGCFPPPGPGPNVPWPPV